MLRLLDCDRGAGDEGDRVRDGHRGGVRERRRWEQAVRWRAAPVAAEGGVPPVVPVVLCARNWRGLLENLVSGVLHIYIYIYSQLLCYILNYVILAQSNPDTETRLALPEEQTGGPAPCDPRHSARS